MKVVVVGFGSIGKRHFENLCSLLDGKVFICTKKQQISKISCSNVFSSLQDCIKEKPDIGFVTNITNLHIQTALHLAKAGCHIFIEKPLSDSQAGIKSLIDIVNKKQLVTLMGCNLRFHPCLVKVKDLVSSGKIGKIISVRAENGSYLPDWHPDEDYGKGYAARKDLGGGVVLTCIHEIDYLYWLFGDVEEVYSVSGKFSDLNIKSEDLSSIIFRFKNDIIGELHLDYFQRPSSRNCTIIGSKGTIHWDFATNTVKYYDIKTKKWLIVLRLKKYDFNSMYVAEAKHFLFCIKNKKKTINDIHQGFKILKIAMAILKSSKTHRPIRL